MRQCEEPTALFVLTALAMFIQGLAIVYSPAAETQSLVCPVRNL